MLLGFVANGVLTCTSCIDGFSLAMNDEQDGVVPLYADELNAQQGFIGKQNCDKCGTHLFTLTEGYPRTEEVQEPIVQKYAVVMRETRYVLYHAEAPNDEVAKDVAEISSMEERDFVMDGGEVVSVVNLTTGKTIRSEPGSDSPYHTPEQEEELRLGMQRLG